MPTSSRKSSTRNTSTRNTVTDDEHTDQSVNEVNVAGSIDGEPDTRDRDDTTHGGHGTDGGEHHSPIATGTGTGDWAEQVGTIVHIDPHLLHLVRNVRDSRPDQGLIDSIRDLGVLEPITALVYVGAKIEQTLTDHTGDGIGAVTGEGPDGSDCEALVVRFGHRRTLAAVEAGRDTVPVYLIGTTDNLTGDEKAADGISRVIEQRDENTHRSGLTVADDLAAVGQLAAFGLSANQIAKRARIKRGDVDAALTVGKSALATGAAARWDDMTLDQLAVVAEFEDDTDAVTALRGAAQTGKFEHVAQRLRDDRPRQVAREAVLSPVAEAGVTVINAPVWHDNTTKALSGLRLDPHTDPGTLTDPTDYAGVHGSCPGHVAWAEETYVWVDAEGNELDEEAPQIEDDGTEETAAKIAALASAWDDAQQVAHRDVTYGCTDWQTHGHVRLWDRVSNGQSSNLPGAGLSPTEEDAAASARQRAEAAEAEAETKRAQRRLVIENNKAWDTAQTVRRDWIATHLATRKTPPKGAAAFVASAICLDRHLFGDIDGNHLAAAWLGASTNGSPTYGVDTTPVRLAADASENRGVVIALIQVLALIEASTGRHTWRQNGENNTAGRYLRDLKDWGYTLSDVEEFTITSRTA